jgi:hypothetical protein
MSSVSGLKMKIACSSETLVLQPRKLSLYVTDLRNLLPYLYNFLFLFLSKVQESDSYNINFHCFVFVSFCTLFLKLYLFFECHKPIIIQNSKRNS